MNILKYIGWYRVCQFLLVWVLFVVSHVAGATEQLTVAVAANVKYVFDELSEEFKRDTGIQIKSVFASSGKIAAQIKSGAPYDLFLSADMEYPELLHKEGFALTPPRVYAKGVLVLWTMNAAINMRSGAKVLSDPAVRKIAISNPKLAPYGRESVRALEYFRMREAVEPKLIYGESISQVNQYVDSKAADVGFTAKSVVLAPQMQGRGSWIELPKESYQPIEQSMVILQHGNQNNALAAAKFMDFMSSAKARNILSRFGYLLP